MPFLSGKVGNYVPRKALTKLFFPRENFKYMAVTPYTFLDLLQWRCHYVRFKVLEPKEDFTVICKRAHL